MDANTWIALLTAIIAGAVALVGYSVTQFGNRRERKSKAYAEALALIREYQELPYRVRQRPSSDNATRAALGGQTSDVLTKLGFYLAWLHIESSEVGTAYNDLSAQVRRFGGDHRDAAWMAGPIVSDEEMTTLKYGYDVDPEMKLCISAMRRELSFWGFLSRRSVQRSLARQRLARAEERARGK